MPHPLYETITERESILDLLRKSVEAGGLCKMELAAIQSVRITSFLRIIETESPYLLVDKAPGEADSALTDLLPLDASFEFHDGEGVPCRFESQAVWCDPMGIIVEFPNAVRRLQQREYFRVAPPIGAKVAFSDPSGKEEIGAITDLSGQGLSFLISKDSTLRVDDILTRLRLILPRGNRPLQVEISRATLKRMEKDEGGRRLAGIDFMEIAEPARKAVISYVFERHRSTIRKIGR